MRAKWPFCPFRLDFPQLICKTSLIFKLNLELAFSIILKQRQLYESMLRWSDVSEYQTCYPFWYAPTTFSTIANNLVCIQNSLSLNCCMFLIKMLYQFVRLLWTAINNRNKELQHSSNGLSLSQNVLSKQLPTINFYILTKSIIA